MKGFETQCKIYEDPKPNVTYVTYGLLEHLKELNPQQVANILLSNDDWHVKTSAGNASGI